MIQAGSIKRAQCESTSQVAAARSPQKSAKAAPALKNIGDDAPTNPAYSAATLSETHTKAWCLCVLVVKSLR
jgi:hypothetical protein